MDRDSSPDLLKQGCSRSVRLVRGAPGEPHAERVVKLFRSYGPDLPGSLLAALGRDRRRATREYQVLRALFEAGLAVPRPLKLEAADPADPTGRGGWEVTMERVPAAPSLMDIFDGLCPWPREPLRLARELGTLLAQLHGAGVRHTDLHAGNVLIGSGPPVAIDFHKARIARHSERGFARAAVRNLIQLVAGSREFVGPAFRARFFVAWRRALPPELRAQLPEPPVLVREVEAAGRLLRRDVVHKRRLRWTRDGTACGTIASSSSGPAFVSRDQRTALFPALAALAAAGPGLHPHPEQPAQQVLIVAGEADAVRRGWFAAARLFEHRLPCARPLAAALGDRAWFALELPAGTRPARTDAALTAAFEDRGLTPPAADCEHVFIDPQGVTLVAGLPDLIPPGRAGPARG